MTSRKEDHFRFHGPAWVERTYKEDPGSIVFDRLRCAQSAIEAKKPKSLLDVGCGDGRFLASATSVPRRVGLDHSERMLELAKTTCAGQPIELALFDFNQDVDTLKRFGRFELVTLMGVIHYLSDPPTAIRILKDVCEADGALLISFRNRLYNVKAESAYGATDLTTRDREYIEDEVASWSGNRGELPSSRTNAERFDATLRDQRYMGLTDPGWNPDGLSQWRQFSPLEAILLLELSGFRPVDIWPLNATGGAGSQERLRQLPACTSFVILAS